MDNFNAYMRSLELRNRPLVDYMETVQTHINAAMRGSIIHWLFSVCNALDHNSCTLCFPVSLLDRFLSLKETTVEKLELLVVSCFLIASKHEELTPEYPESMSWITNNRCSPEEVEEMEKDILRVVEPSAGNLTVIHFIWKYFLGEGTFSVHQSEYRTTLLACYIALLSLLDYGCLRFFPSMIAAASVFLAKLTGNPSDHPWTMKLQEVTGYRPSELMECVQALHDLYLRQFSLLTNNLIQFGNYLLMDVSDLVPPSEIRASHFADLPN